MKGSGVRFPKAAPGQRPPPGSGGGLLLTPLLTPRSTLDLWSSGPPIAEASMSGAYWGDPELTWPREEKRMLHPAVPRSVRRHMEEAEHQLQTGWLQAAAVAARRALEGVCQNKGVDKDATLHAGLSELRDLDE
ncbi:DUF4145 domain-containing protein [Streptosporangium sp. LJ11]|uniref:DUF4145 domain-containing protein n=1 Tax=Streptosporangium sp. LJ11 TaxID=3436927 RepID=UPI003F79BF9C